jgi:molybdenum cofactor biosynthesis protein B
MSVEAHRAAAPSSLACAVITVSDTRTRDTDASGEAIATLLAGAGHVVAHRGLVPDDGAAVTAAVRAATDLPGVRVVITTGGTGLSRRDTTAEVLSALFDKTIDGFGELFRALSFQDIGAAAMLSRATAGLVGRSVVFVLPGSEAAVRLAVTRLILPELGHIVRELDR